MSENMPAPDPFQEYRKLPAVDALLHLRSIQELRRRYGTAAVTTAIRHAVDEVRREIGQGGEAPPFESWPPRVAHQLEANSPATLRTVINATGVIIHTNLGRAPLSVAARAAVQALSTGYNNLEYDLETGTRGSRYDHVRALLCTLTGAEDALVVNNNASAVYLALAALCQGRKVIISRGQLVEIGGGFRIPDVLHQSGARLVEVGTTNRTHIYDFENAVDAETAAFMRVHSSNFRQIGFVAMPELAALVAAARSVASHRLLVIDDLGSGTLLDTTPYGLAAEPLVQESVAAGADLIMFSGDKLLGGPQAGLIVGSRAAITVLRRHPMVRALRVDKMTLAALEATLQTYHRGSALTEIPVWRMISATVESLHRRVETWRQHLEAHGLLATILPGESTVGGGSLPGETLPTVCLALDLPHPDDAAARLRRAETPVIGRIQQGFLLFDPRTVAPEEDVALINVLLSLKQPQ